MEKDKITRLDDKRGQNIDSIMGPLIIYHESYT